jgi:hypothetical protein
VRLLVSVQSVVLKLRFTSLVPWETQKRVGEQPLERRVGELGTTLASVASYG